MTVMRRPVKIDFRLYVELTPSSLIWHREGTHWALEPRIIMPNEGKMVVAVLCGILIKLDYTHKITRFLLETGFEASKKQLEAELYGVSGTQRLHKDADVIQRAYF